MTPDLRNTIAFGVILGLAALLGPLRYRRWWVGIPVALIALGAVLGLELWTESAAGLPWEQVGTILAWLLLGHTARVAGGPVLPRSLGLVAALLGWLMGDIAAAALIAGLVADRGTAIRCALVASAASMISPIGSPVAIVLIDPAYFGPLPLLLALMAWPVGAAPERQGKLPVSLILGAVAAGVAWYPDFRLVALAVGALLLAGLARKDLQPERFPAGDGVFALAAGVLAWGARHAGLGRELLAGVEMLQDALPEYAAVVFAGVGLLAGALLGEAAAAPIAASLLGASSVPVEPAVLAPIAAGVAVGGVGPLWMIWRYHKVDSAQPFHKDVLRPMGLQVLVVFAWASLTDELVF